MSKPFETIEQGDLADVTGGADGGDAFFAGAGPNRFSANGQIKGTFAGMEISGG